ncbi:glutathione S-transferase family protein [Sessilibacter corallicola]|uniref:Glutathione S-transferase n=1 Tax=Sessilibacter corallicola TaxID=2904075 RepID=A0ABQ0AER0_9GAMM|nr:glutathione S-transferase family protein [Sessilibacter corallicola]MCE2029439.1 glutathione S-transferase family protein [Sessilibacter corallicola]
MYTLYYMPGGSSFGIHALLVELKQKYTLKFYGDIPNYLEINPTGGVPTLEDDGMIIREGAAIALHLIEKHDSNLLPTSRPERTEALQWLMMANASIHPAYGKMFFIANNVKDEKLKIELFQAQAETISDMWQIVNKQLEGKAFICGDEPTVADFLLPVYANWSRFFPVKINYGSNFLSYCVKMMQYPSFAKAISVENIEYSVL